MAKHRIIYVSQEISPYLTGTPNGKFGRDLPQAMSGRKYEVRTFMPDFGDVNERRNQLHEVIRLSGLNIPIGDNDHPLVVKVASMQPSRVQVYFIDSDDYFQKLDSDVDSFGSNREDNDERAIFFAHGTLDTARKLQWEPELVQVSGWMCALVPLYLKRIFTEGASLKKSKVVYTVLPGTPPASIGEEIFAKLKAEGTKPADLKKLREIPLDSNFFHKVAILYSDAVAFRGVDADPDLLAFCESLGVKTIHVDGEGDATDAFESLYDELVPKTK